MLQNTNEYLNKIPTSANLLSLVDKSLFVSLMRRYTRITGSYNVISTAQRIKNIIPIQLKDMRVIKQLFQSILPITSIDHSITENWLWDLYNSYKLHTNQPQATPSYLINNK